MFNPGDKVAVLNLMVNDIIRDRIDGVIIKYLGHGTKKGMYMVEVNQTIIYLSPDKMELWDKK